MQELIDITANVTLEIGGKEYNAEVNATFYPAILATYDDDGEDQKTIFNYVSIEKSNFDTKFYHGDTLIRHALCASNYNRCLSAIQQKIESL